MTFKCFALTGLLSLLSFSNSYAGSIDDIRSELERSSLSQIQEKVYVHTDNSCYFVGDTLWYKAYVVRADNLVPTDLSRVLYVELLSPDGLLVERQQIVINAKGYTCGQFVLTDSLYSGYYELRAYTRWMLNFNMHQHHYSTTDRWAFFSKQMAADYYRVWEGLYSRVFPVYGKPETAGDYSLRRMYQRPKARIPKPKKENLIVTFYPEGGHLIEGVENNVAFEIVNQLGEAINVSGTVESGDVQSFKITPEYMGRGSFRVTPGSSRLKASFTYRDKNYTFSLPRAERNGVSMFLRDSTVNLSFQGLKRESQYALSILCRGSLKHFQAISSDATRVDLPFSLLPTGVNEITIFNDEGQILADRLFFVNHHDYDSTLITAPIITTHTYNPYEKIEIPFQCLGVTEPTSFSLSIQDRNTLEPTYDDGNLMTSMLLSSDLRGFIARPAYYFERDDDQHRRHLDLLMQVQGWRKYKWQELADSTHKLRYAPELGLTVEGHVYKMIPLDEVEPDEIESWLTGVGMIGTKDPTDPNSTENPWAEETQSEMETIGVETATESTVTTGLEMGEFSQSIAGLRSYSGSLRKDVLVEAEIAVGKDIVGSVQKTEHGHYLFNVPPFYGVGYLNMKAYKENDSIKKNMISRSDRTVLDEDAFPDYYVKRDLFYPMFTHEYNYYEKHQPDIDEDLMIDSISDLSMENDVYQLGNVTVKGRRRGRRAIDWNKPAFVVDAYQMYNDLTDYGLSYGKLDMRLFPVQVCRYLFGNMNRYRMFNVDGRLDGYTYYRNYSPYTIGSEAEKEGLVRAHRTPQWYINQLKLRRLQDIRVFTDYEPRNEDSTMVESMNVADATVDLVLIPNDGKQPSFRDRHILFQGFNAPEAFYQPDYSERQPETPSDYRRTLYWNPNAVTDEEGRFTATFFNNSKPTRITMSAAGVTADGRLLHSK